MSAKKLDEIMTQNVSVVRPDDSISKAAQLMQSLDVGMLPVCDGERIKGTITDRDITVRAVAEGKAPETTPVKDVMTEEVIYLYEDQDVEEAARLMQIKQVRRLIILDRHKKLAGIVSLGDIWLYQKDGELSSEVLKGVSEPRQAHAT